LPALKIVENTIGNRVLAEQIARVAEETRGGDSLAGRCGSWGFFRERSVQMIDVGEETGKLDEMLLKVAEIEERQNARAYQGADFIAGAGFDCGGGRGDRFHGYRDPACQFFKMSSAVAVKNSGANFMKMRVQRADRAVSRCSKSWLVLVIIVILAATIIPQFIGTTHDAKVGAAKGQVAELESAGGKILRASWTVIPTSEEGLKVLVDAPTGEDWRKNWRGPYIKQLSQRSLGPPVSYQLSRNASSDDFDVWSQGAGGQGAGGGDAAEIGNW